jgi:hypothetical protein
MGVSQVGHAASIRDERDMREDKCLEYFSQETWREEHNFEDVGRGRKMI